MSADRMDIARLFVERLPGAQRHGLATLDLHDDRAFQHVDERIRVMAMHRIDRARRIFDGDHHRFLAGKVRQCLTHYRSEEHTSELQSLMRISYAVFCLKKKITRQMQTNTELTTNQTHQTH